MLLTSALLHDPKVLFLDEPLSGLDVASTLLVKTFLCQLAEGGRTVFYCSHVMDVVERLCDRIAILNEGVLVTEGTPAEIAKARGGGNLESVFASLTSTADAEEEAVRMVEALTLR